MLIRILIIAKEPQWARNWADRNIKAHDRMPVTCGLENCRSYLRGGRDILVVFVDLEPEILGQDIYMLRYCTVMTVSER